MLLNVENLTVHYGKALAVEKAYLEVDQGKIVTLIGSNGAGKTTILKVISGLKKPTHGDVWFSGKRINGMAPYDIARLGLVHVPEGRRLFPFLSVMENLKLGASVHNSRSEMKADMEKVFDNFPILRERSSQKAGSMSGGEQQMLAIGRALMAKPELLLLDEPSLGLAPLVVDELAQIIRKINQDGVSVLLVEQNVSLALGLASRGYVLEVGSIILQGDMSELEGNEIIQRAYLGG
jgi:branched-chain amino acid transport system ATP-binding protein